MNEKIHGRAWYDKLSPQPELDWHNTIYKKRLRRPPLSRKRKPVDVDKLSTYLKKVEEYKTRELVQDLGLVI